MQGTLYLPGCRSSRLDHLPVAHNMLPRIGNCCIRRGRERRIDSDHRLLAFCSAASLKYGEHQAQRASMDHSRAAQEPATVFALKFYQPSWGQQFQLHKKRRPVAVRVVLACLYAAVSSECLSSLVDGQQYHTPVSQFGTLLQSQFTCAAACN